MCTNQKRQCLILKLSALAKVSCCGGLRPLGDSFLLEVMANKSNLKILPQNFVCQETVSVNPCPVEPGYALPLQTV